MINVLFAVKSYVIQKGLIAIMQQLNLEFRHEEIKNPSLLLKSGKSEKYVLFFCPDDYPEMKGNYPFTDSVNLKIILLQNSEHAIIAKPDFETIDLYQGKSGIQGQILKVFKSLKDSGVKDEVNEILSDREKVVVREIVLGYTNKEIADRLFISPHTVIAHRKNITGKLGIKSVPGLTIYAILHNIISEEDIKQATRPSDPDTHK